LQGLIVKVKGRKGKLRALHLEFLNTFPEAVQEIRDRETGNQMAKTPQKLDMLNLLISNLQKSHNFL
jgi:hypothetical protein